VRFTTLDSFGWIIKHMENLVHNLPEEALLEMRAEIQSMTRVNCPWYTYRAAQLLAPEVDKALGHCERARDRSAAARRG
jgi:hypothetical protein